MQTLREAIETGSVLVADGGTGTEMQKQGLPVGACGEEWNLSHPEQVTAVSQSYAQAGSQVVYTNTFGANRYRLQRHGLAGRVAEINRAGVECARAGVQAASGSRPPVFVVGSIGPTGGMLEPLGDLTPQEAVALFREQVEALAAAGVDGLVVETFSALEEIEAALQAVRETVPNLPLIASMSFDTGGRTMMGVTPEKAVAFLADAGALVVGANCSIGPEVVERVLQAMRSARPGVRLLAKPNAGLPQMVGGRPVYPVTPEEMAVFARRAKELGAVVIGGCCGTTPDHIAAMAAALYG